MSNLTLEVGGVVPYLNAVPNVPFTVCVEISTGIVLKSETGSNQNETLTTLLGN